MAQLTNNKDRMPSAAASELGESSCMASIILFPDNIISVQYNSLTCSMDCSVCAISIRLLVKSDKMVR